MSANTYGSNKRTLIILLRCKQDLKIDATLGEEAFMLQRMHSAVALHVALHLARSYSSNRFLHAWLGSRACWMWAHWAYIQSLKCNEPWLQLSHTICTCGEVWTLLRGDMDHGRLLSNELWKLPPYVVPSGRAVPLASCWSELGKGPVRFLCINAWLTSA